MSDKTVLLRVRPGMTFGATGQYAPGDLVELPEGVLVAFGDKLELVEPVAEAPPEAEPEPAPKRRKENKAVAAT